MRNFVGAWDSGTRSEQYGNLFQSVSSETKTETRLETKQTTPLFSTHFAEPYETMKHAVRLRARYMDGNDPIGDYSNTVKVVTVP